MPFVHDNAGGWVRDRIRRDEHARCTRVGEALDRIVNTPAFDPAAVSALANRHDLPVACSLLNFNRTFDEGSAAVRFLHDAPNMVQGSLHIRAARIAGVFTMEDRDIANFTVDWLRRSDSPRAPVALALIGEIEWPTASVEARRAFVLRELVRAFRERQAS